MEVVRFLLFYYFLILALFENLICNCNKVIISPHDLSMEIGGENYFKVYLSELPVEDVEVCLLINHTNIVEINKYKINFNNQSWHSNVTVDGINAGKIVVNVNYTNLLDYNLDDAFIRVNIKIHDYLDVMANAFGWTYFACWTSNFYPQWYLNFRRKSVTGLSLDYIMLNLLGTFSYTVYNFGIYFSSRVQDQYFDLHQYGILPIRTQDVAFSIISFCWTGVCGLQGLYYNHKTIRLSKIWMSVLGLGIVFEIISSIIAGVGVISWLDCLYYFSYVKLGITTVKYIPQVYSNYKNKSTSGWSVGFPILDFSGGSLSILQMFIMAYNYDDWNSIFGNPTKFLLGLVSMFFDVCFLVQHFILYRKSKVSEHLSVNGSINKLNQIDDERKR